MQASASEAERILGRIRVFPTVHRGRPGVRLDDDRELGYGRRDRHAVTHAVFLFCAEGGHPRIASAMCRHGGDPGPALDAIVAGPDLGPPPPSTWAAALLGGENGATPGSGHGCPEDVEDAVKGRVRDAVRTAVAASDLPANVRDAVRALHGWPAGLAVPATLELAAPGAAADRALALANPLGYLMRREMLGAGAPAPSPALMRRLATFGPGDVPDADLVELGRLATRVPVDWIPPISDRAALRAFADVARIHAAMPAECDAGAILVSVAGDWVGFRDRCVAAVAAGRRGADTAFDARDVERTVRYEIDDVSEALARAVLLPLALRAGEEPDRDDPTADLRARAFSLLYGGKSLPAILETARRWHAHLHEVRSAMPSDVDDRTWPALHPTIADGPYEIVPLTSSVDLMEEGSPRPDPRGVPGLDHCIGGVHYREAGVSRVSHYVSVRRPCPGDGLPYARVATAELAFEHGKLVARQVQGLGNADVPPDAAEALDRYVALPVAVVEPLPFVQDPDAIRRAVGYDPHDDVLLARAIRAWEPYLARDLRGLAPESLGERVGLPARGPAPTP